MKTKNIDFYKLGFKIIETKMMYVSDFKNGQWDEGRIIPFGPFEISPAACVLNYGQGIFEGMKALRTKNGGITIFRPRDNARRLNMSADRVLMPRIDEKRFVEAVKQIVKANEEFIPPYDSGGVLYIRPLMIGNGPVLGIVPAKEFKFLIFVSPVGPYFPEGFKGIDLIISKKYTRVSPGGTGFSKTCSNYVGTMKPAKEAKQNGFAQVLYLDPIQMKYINEVGSANFCAIIDDKLVTPKFDGTVLEGITLKSVLTIAGDKLGLTVEQRDIAYGELFQDSCTEAFCTGNATVITPIKSIVMEENTKIFNNGKPGETTTNLYNLLTSIQRLDIPDDYGWVIKL